MYPLPNTGIVKLFITKRTRDHISLPEKLGRKKLLNNQLIVLILTLQIYRKKQESYSCMTRVFPEFLPPTFSMRCWGLPVLQHNSIPHLPLGLPTGFLPPKTFWNEIRHKSLLRVQPTAVPSGVNPLTALRHRSLCKSCT